MLDNHPQLTVANDTHFITRAAKRVLRKDPQPLMTPELLDAVISYRRFYRMGLDEAEVIKAAEDCPSYAEFVGRLYNLRGQRKQKLLWFIILMKSILVFGVSIVNQKKFLPNRWLVILAGAVMTI